MRVNSTRLVSFTQRAIAAISYEVEALARPLTVVVQSELVANEALPVVEGSDPRVAAALTSPLVSELFMDHDARSVLVHTTRASGLHVAGAMDHVIEGPAGTEFIVESFEDLARLTVTADVAPGETLRIVKFLAYGWSASARVPALRDQVGAALARGPPRTAGTGCSPSSAPTSTTSGSAPTSRSRATPSCSRPCASPSSTCSRRARAPSAARSRRRA